jgi:hypothetical protein
MRASSFEFADEHSVAEDRGMILDHRPADPSDLLARVLADRIDPGADGDEVRRDVGAERMHVRLHCLDFAVHARNVGANVAQEFKDEASRRLAQPDPCSNASAE